MLFSDLITSVRAITGHDVDTQFSDSTQLLPVLQQEYRRLRRWLGQVVPNLCELTGTVVVASAGATYTATMTIDGVTGSPVAMTASNLIPKSIMTDFERIRRVEKLIGGDTYYPLNVVDDLNCANSKQLSVHEQPDRFAIYPTAEALGTFRLTWVSGAPSSITTGTTVNLPVGLEDVMINRGAEFVSIRHDPQQAPYFRDRAEMILKEQKRLLISRYGAMPAPGFTMISGY